ncbi:hypothetical protein HHK36_015145 [Tetracentron sinense]|uniref:GDSL esterase/lipase n=1 Tax=Tetracentron sinense TaxID=13715 RepID=A0A834Z4C1_TETSI|nr:hypothetical protein HHK36_015145 [Tetracentron sinense]
MLKWGSRVSTAQVPAMFVFGDSLVDDVNNNYLSSIAKSNYLPYGIDFSRRPSGRFSNGRTIIDMLEREREREGSTLSPASEKEEDSSEKRSEGSALGLTTVAI